MEIHDSFYRQIKYDGIIWTVFLLDNIYGGVKLSQIL